MSSQRALFVALFTAGLLRGALACGSDSDSAGTTGTTTGTGGQGGGTSSSTTTSTTGSTSTGGGGGSASPMDTFCAELATPFCEALLACCADPPTGFGTTLPECLTQWQAECNVKLGEQLKDVIDSGDTVLDSAKLSACAAKLQAMSAGGEACKAPPFAVLQLECLSAFEAQVPVGQPCNAATDFPSYVQCAAGYCPSGTCEPFLTAGSPCTVDAAPYCNIAAGEWCLPGPNGTECAPRAALFAPCASPNQDDDLSCLSLHCDAAGICQPPTATSVCKQ